MTHLSPSFWVQTTSKCSDKSSCSQTKAPCEKLCFCFEMKILPFSGILSEVRSIVEITKGVQSKILDHKFLKLWTYHPPPLTLSARRSWYTSIVHPVLTSRVYCFFVFFIYSDTHWLLSTQWRRIQQEQQWESFWILFDGMHPCFITYDARQMRHWWGLLQTTLCFPVTAQPDWFMCIPLGQRETFLQFYTSFHLICNSAIYSGMWENM